MDKSWLSLENYLRETVIKCLMLLIESWELLKDHSVCGTTPIKFLFWEFVSIFVTYAHGNIVVSLDSANSSPKQKLIIILSNGFVEQLLERIFKLESLFNIKNNSIMRKNFESCSEVFNISHSFLNRFCFFKFKNYRLRPTFLVLYLNFK
jgi:hypothetical protein